MFKLAKIFVLPALLVILCGFSPFGFETQVYRGEPVRDALARLGPPVKTAYADGQRILYWHVIRFDGRKFCKIWGAARRGVILNWGYEECAFW